MIKISLLDTYIFNEIPTIYEFKELYFDLKSTHTFIDLINFSNSYYSIKDDVILFNDKKYSIKNKLLNVYSFLEKLNFNINNDITIGFYITSYNPTIIHNSFFTSLYKKYNFL